MNLEKIKKIKDQIEKILEKVKTDAVTRGTDINSPDFQDKIWKVKRKILNKFGIKESDYDSVDGMLERQNTELDNMDVGKEIFLAMQEITNQEKIIKDIPTEIAKIKFSLDGIENKKINWSDIHGKPDHVLKSFDPKNIKGLEFGQIVHPDADHKWITSRIGEVSVESGSQIEKAKQELTSLITEIKINHRDLLGIGPDDHHQEKHILESHLDSDLMKKMIRLTNGSIVDDLHTHQIEMGAPQLIGGTTLGDVANFLVTNELIGTGNDVDTEFTLKYEPYDTSTIDIHVGPAKLFLTDDFTVSGLTNQTIILILPAPDGYKIRANYRRR